MRFKLDENIPVSVKLLIDEAGHQASTVYDEGLSGASDRAVAVACKAGEMILVTLDMDFANVLSFPPMTHPGIIVLRLPQMDAGAVRTVVSEFLSTADWEELRGATAIVEPGRMRIRK